MSGDLKLPIAQGLNRLGWAKAQAAIEQLGTNLPCTVANVTSSGIVTVNFEVEGPWTLPQIDVPIQYSEYVRYPIKVGDKGLVIAADAYLGSMSGLGGGTANILQQPGNLSALSFVWLGNVEWSPTDDPQALVGYGYTGAILRDIQSQSVLTASSSDIKFDSPVAVATGNLAVESNPSASFTTPTGQIITVQSGIVTNASSAVSPPINPAYFANLRRQITIIQNQLSYFEKNGFGKDVVAKVQQQLLRKLQKLTNKLIPSLLAQVNSIETQMAALSPMVALSTMPVGNIEEVLIFVSGLQTAMLTPLVAPHAQYVVQLPELRAQITSLTGSINTAATTLGGNVSIPTKPNIQQGQKVSVQFTVTRA